MKTQRTVSKPARFEDYLKPIPPDRPLGVHYKVQVAAMLLGKSTKWIKQKIQEGKLDGYLLGHDIVVTLESINRYLEICRITGEALAASKDDGEDDED